MKQYLGCGGIKGFDVFVHEESQPLHGCGFVLEAYLELFHLHLATHRIFTQHRGHVQNFADVVANVRCARDELMHFVLDIGAELHQLLQDFREAVRLQLLLQFVRVLPVPLLFHHIDELAANPSLQLLILGWPSPVFHEELHHIMLLVTHRIVHGRVQEAVQGIRIHLALAQEEDARFQMSVGTCQVQCGAIVVVRHSCPDPCFDHLSDLPEVILRSRFAERYTELNFAHLGTLCFE
mmetsp:Transcript_47894/g.112131  ORF Transcript_47894/g.112131 Transcript_47894/m.112131 type:complete len:237 (-) Transcript_47894:632-1342(-)